MTKRRSNRSILVACVLTFACSTLAWSEQVTFKVKHEFRANPDSTRLWWLVGSGAVLGLDDSARRLTVTTKQNPLDLGFDLKGATTDAMKKCASLLGVGLYLSRKAPAPYTARGAWPDVRPGGATGSPGKARSLAAPARR